MVALVDVLDPLRRWQGRGIGAGVVGGSRAVAIATPGRVASGPYLQQNQPTGVPPLRADRRADAARRAGGELLVPAARRRLRVDRRARCGGCGWSTWRAARATGRRPPRAERRRGDRRRRQPRGLRARPAALHGANLSFQRGLVEEFDEPVDAVVFLQTIEHIHEPGKLLERIAKVAPVAYISTPNRLTLAGPDAEKSDNPWHLREYDIGAVPGAARAALRRGRDPRPLPRPQAPGPRAGDQARLGPLPPGAPPHQALLRPLHPGDLRAGLRAASRDDPRQGTGLRGDLPDR